MQVKSDHGSLRKCHHCAKREIEALELFINPATVEIYPCGSHLYAPGLRFAGDAQRSMKRSRSDSE